MDKYYSLMRRVLRSTFIMLRQTGWNERALNDSNDFLVRVGGPLQ